MTKVFGIGFHKTGTSSLGRALEILGYKSCLGANELRNNLGELKMMRCLFSGDHELLYKYADQYDAFTDLPWFAIYKSLDTHYPNSKFILTIREEESWLASAKRYFANTVSPFRLWLYGQPNPISNEDAYLNKYRAHNQEVIHYFSGRNCLLVIDLNEENKWRVICDFLNKPVPTITYPHMNSRGTR